MCFSASMGREKQESYRQFWGDLRLSRGGELPFLEAEVVLREMHTTLRKNTLCCLFKLFFHTQIFLFSLMDTSFEDVLKYYKQLTSHTLLCFQAFY